MQETFIYIYIFILIIYFIILLCTYLELRRTIINANSAFTLFYYYFCCVLSSLLILVDCLFAFMFISKYGSSTGRAVGPTFKLGPTRICVRPEYSRRSSIDDEIVDFHTACYFKRSLPVSRPPGSG